MQAQKIYKYKPQIYPLTNYEREEQEKSNRRYFFWQKVFGVLSAILGGVFAVLSGDATSIFTLTLLGAVLATTDKKAILL